MYLFINYQFLLKDGLHKRLDSLYKLVPSKKKHIYIITQRRKQNQMRNNKKGIVTKKQNC